MAIIERLVEILGAPAKRKSSITTMAFVSRTWASRITFLRSTRSLLAPEAVSWKTPLVGGETSLAKDDDLNSQFKPCYGHGYSTSIHQ
jgi:hypothetical protein